MGQDWSVRAYHDGDEEAMLGLYRAVYGETMGREEWLEQWRWKYRRNPVGSAVIWLAEAGGKLVGQYPLNPVRMKAGGEVVTGVQMVELMTHPDYRQQGISLALAEQALGDARSRGLDITYGFPNKQAYPSHIRAGYTDVGAQGAWIMPLNTDRILEKWLKNRLPAKIFAAGAGLVLKGFSRTHELPEVEGLLVSQVSSFDERVNELCEVVSREHNVIVVRDRDYLNWRYTDVPGVSYTIYVAGRGEEMVGYVVLKCEEQAGLVFGRIFELIVLPGQGVVARHLLKQAVGFFEAAGADLIIYRLVGNRPYRKYLKESGFMYSGWLSRRARFIARSNTTRIFTPFLSDPANWFMQSGDSDAV